MNKSVTTKKKIARVNLSIPEEVLQLIDEDIVRSYTTRSGWITKAAVMLLEKRKKEEIDLIVNRK